MEPPSTRTLRTATARAARAPHGRRGRRSRVRRSATALAVALAAAALPIAATAPAVADAPTGNAPAAHGNAAADAQDTSSGWNDSSCKPSAEHPRPVVLVHGTGGNKTDNWLGLAPYLVKRGYCVFSLDYGQREGVPAAYGLGPVEKSAEQLAAFVDDVRSETGSSKVDIVGHSQGGMMPRQYLKFLGGADKVHSLVGIAPSNHGTTLDGLARLADLLPPLGDSLEDFGPALMEQKEGSDFLKRLNEGGDTVPGVHYTVLATRYDEVVTPYKTQFLDGPDVRNVVLQDLCPTDLSDHLAVGLSDKVAFHETANALDPAHATPTTCTS